MKGSSLILCAILMAGCASHRHMSTGHRNFGTDVGADQTQTGEFRSTKDRSSERASLATTDRAHEEIMRLGKPGEEHKKLEPLIGTWKHTVRWWMNPDSKPQVMTGTNVNHWILGKRFVMQEVKGGDPKQPFAGLGLTGFDRVRSQYTTTWIDNMSTGTMAGSGRINHSGSAIIESGEFSCPMTGEKNMPYHAVLSMDDDNHYNYEMFVTDPDGKEFKSLDIVYERIGSKPKATVAEKTVEKKKAKA